MLLAKLYDYSGAFISTQIIKSIKWTRQKNKEYSFDIELSTEMPATAYSVSIIDTDSKLRFNPSGVLAKSNGGNSFTVDSWENMLSSAAKIPEGWEGWDGHSLESVIADHCYGFVRMSFAGLAQLNGYVAKSHVSVAEIDSGNGSVYLDTFQYLSTNELAYYEDGYIIYRLSVPEGARRAGMVARWMDVVGNHTDISVQFRWSNSNTDYSGAYSAEQSPVRSANVKPNETIGVDIPESDNQYLFIRFNLKYNAGIDDINYDNEITTVAGDPNIVYYGSTPMLSAFEIIYRTDTMIVPGTISVGGTLMVADIHNKDTALDSLKAIGEAYDIYFNITTTANGIHELNATASYVNDLTQSMGAVSDIKDAKISRNDESMLAYDACECFGAGEGLDRIYAMVLADGVTTPRNILKFDDNSITSLASLQAAGAEYIDSQNSESSTVSFDHFGESYLALNDVIKILVDGIVYKNAITEESISSDGSGVKRSYVMGIKKYPFSSMFDPTFNYEYISGIRPPYSVSASRTLDSLLLSWMGDGDLFIVEYKVGAETQYTRIETTGKLLTIANPQNGVTYQFRVYSAIGSRISQPSSTVIYSEIPTAISGEIVGISDVPMISMSSSTASRQRDGTITPVSFTASSVKRSGGMVNAIFSIEITHDGSTFSEIYRSSAPENIHSTTIPETVNDGGVDYFVSQIRVSLYSDATLATKYDSKFMSISPSMDTSPIYWGSRATAPAATIMPNDFYFDSNTVASGGGLLRYWTGFDWVEMTSAHPAYRMAVWQAIPDMSEWSDAQDSVVAAASGIFSKLFAYDAYLANIFARTITVASGGRIRYETGDGIQKRAVQLADEKIDWLDTPDTSPASSEQLRARIGRLGIGGTILLDGDFRASMSGAWSAESIINPSGVSFPDCIQSADGTIRVAYARDSDYYLVERVWSGLAWGSEVVINAAISYNPSYVQFSDGTIKIAYVRDSDRRLIERTWSGSTWGAETIVNPASSNQPDYIRLMDGTIRISYIRTSDNYLVERVWSGSAWGAESVINNAFSFLPNYIQLSDGTIRIAYGRATDNYLVERVWSGSAWGAESVINAAASYRSNYIQLINGTIRVAYRRTSDGYLVERTWSGSAWGAESVVNPASSEYPNYIQLSNGSIQIIYGVTGKLVGRTIQRYAKLGAGVTKHDTDSDGEYMTFGDDTTLYIDQIKSPGGMYRNLFVNGNFDFWQRGDGPFNNTSYSADRWQCSFNTGGSSFSVSKSSDVPSGIGAWNSLVLTNNTATTPRVMQKIERDRTRGLVGKRTTLSFWAKRVTHSDQLRLMVLTPTAPDNYSGTTAHQTIDITLTTSWVKYTVTFNALPAGAVNGVAVMFIQNGSNNGSIYLAQAKYEPGPVATPFEFLPYQVQFDMCRYYYEVVNTHGQGGTRGLDSGAVWFSATGFEGAARIFTPKRAQVNVTVGPTQVFSGPTILTLASMPFRLCYVDGVALFYGTVAAGGTIGYPMNFGPGLLTVDAEIY